MKNKIYVGRAEHRHRYVFRSNVTPTEYTHGTQFAAVIGPFQTIRGAQFMAEYGCNNPHCLTVDDVEKLAKAEGNKPARS